MRSGEEIQSALRAFVQRWSGYGGNERQGAQTFLDELFACYGLDRMGLGAVFEQAGPGGIVDLIWPGVCLFEMKAPSQEAHLVRHYRDQAHRYWHESSDASKGIRAARFVVLSSLTRFQIWEPGAFPNAEAPLIDLALENLPDNYEALRFLIGQEPYFPHTDRALTTDATRQVLALLDQLQERKAADVDQLQTFVLQLVWCLFAERLGLIHGHPVERTVELTLEQLKRDPDVPSGTYFSTMFALLNQQGVQGKSGMYEGLAYVNGGLFARQAFVDLGVDDLLLIREIADYEWNKVNPTIFGSLMEGYFHKGERTGRGQRSTMGAHYTHEVDILKIVEPTIVEPWKGRIGAAVTVAEAVGVLEDLCRFRVLDPACGCGNFLYVAYRKLRDLEAAAKRRIQELAKANGEKLPEGPLPYYPVSNLHGIEIEPFSVLLTRVTLWMGHKLAADEHGLAEPVLPLADLSGIWQNDALKVEWPEVDAIIGNPPFNGSQWLRKSLGDEYVEWLKKEFGCGIKDYCVYWFRKAHDHLPDGGRAGLVGTNSISQNKARSASLDYIVANGGVITNAISTQKWPGEAKVHVSLVNWVKRPPVSRGPFVIDGKAVTGIGPELRSVERSTGEAHRLAANRGVCFQGPIPGNKGFLIDEATAESWVRDSRARYRDVVRPFLGGGDIVESVGASPSRWTVDFGTRTLEEAARYPEALEWVRQRVRPERDRDARPSHRDKWWQFIRPRPAMWHALQGRSRYIVCNQVGKRILYVPADAWWCPNSKTNVFALGEDWELGVLSAAVHGAWVVARAATLKSDLSYTPTTVFETFPWPGPTEEQRDKIGGLALLIVERRQEICLAEKIGLTELYNRVDDGAYQDLKKLHAELDEAVAEAYGWPRNVAHDPDEIVRRLLALNLEIAEGKREYDPFRKKGEDRPMVLPE